jgi:hypothetical protein
VFSALVKYGAIPSSARVRLDFYPGREAQTTVTLSFAFPNSQMSFVEETSVSNQNGGEVSISAGNQSSNFIIYLTIDTFYV